MIGFRPLATYLAAAVGVAALAGAPAAQAGEEVSEGGYLQRLLANAKRGLLGDGERSASVGGSMAATLTATGVMRGFTPRLSGLPSSAAARGEAGAGRISLSFAESQLSDFGVGVMTGQPAADPDGAPLAVGGMLGYGPLSLNAAFVDEEAAGRPGGMTTAGVAYGIGRVTTSLTYGFDESEESSDVLALGADVSILPNLAVGGGVVFDEEDGGEGWSASSGMLMLRLRY